MLLRGNVCLQRVVSSHDNTAASHLDMGALGPQCVRDLVFKAAVHDVKADQVGAVDLVMRPQGPVRDVVLQVISHWPSIGLGGRALVTAEQASSTAVRALIGKCGIVRVCAGLRMTCETLTSLI